MKWPGLIILSFLLCQSDLAWAEEVNGKPNVLFIAVDDLNDWVGCLGGHPQASTPNIDRLAKRGLLFSNAHCAAPACTPSRTSLFTGQLPQRTGVWANRPPKLDQVRPGATVLPMSFQQAGYHTLGAGKLGPNKAGYDDYYTTEQRWSPFPNKQAVEYQADELASKGTSDPRHVLKFRGQEFVLPRNGMPSDRRPEESSGESFDWGPIDLADEEFGDTRITNWAIDQLQASHQRPLFLAIGYYRPHQPLWAPQRFFDRFRSSRPQLPAVMTNDLEDLSEAGKSWALTPVTSGSHATVVEHEQWLPAVEAYLACVSYIDYEIGRLLDAVDHSPLRDNTLVVLWSDHGWHLGEKEHWGKWTGWERSTKVPLILAPPATSTLSTVAGQQCNQPVNLIDVFPTLAELCQLPAPPHPLDGQSLVPLLETPDHETGRAVVTMFDHGNASLRTNRWRYIRYADGSEELYDLREDPHEWFNLATVDKFANTKTKLAAQTEKYLDDDQWK